MANIEEAIRRLQFLYETHGAEQVAAAQRAITASTETTEKASLSLERSFGNLERRYISTVRAQNEYERAVRVANDAVKQNPALQDRANAVINAAQTQYIRAAQGAGTYGQAVQQMADTTRLARHEMINMSRQIQDIGVSLASGQSFWTVMIQQGAQVFDIFASSGGTVMGFFRQASTAALNFAKSTAGVATGVAAMGVAWAAAAVSFSSGQNDIERALAGMGAASGLTSKKINEIATASSSAFGLSTAQAREAATAFAATGRIYEDNVKTATGAVSDFAKATGTDAAAATKALAAALVDPAAGALELNKQFNFLDATSLEYIRTLQAQGKMQEAQAAMMELLIPKIQKMAEKVSGLGPAYDLAANAASNFWGLLGKHAPLGPAAEVRAPSMGQQDTAKEERFKQMSTDANAAEESILGVRGQIRQLDEQLSKLRSLREAVGGAETGAEQVGNVRVQQLRDQEQALIRQAQVTQQIAAQYPGMSIEVAKQLDAMNGQLLVANARTGAEKMIAQELADQATYIAQGKTQEEAIALAAGNRAKAEADAKAEIDKQIQALNDEIALSKARVDGTEAAVAAEIAYRKALEATGDELKAQEVRAKTRQRDDAKARETGGRYYSQNATDATNKAAAAADSYADATNGAAGSASAWGRAVEVSASGVQNFGNAVRGATQSVKTFVSGVSEWVTLSEKIGTHSRWAQFEGQEFESTYDPLRTQAFKQGMENAYGAENIEAYFQSTGPGYGFTNYRVSQAYLDKEQAATIAGLNVSSPGAIQASLQQVLPMGDLGTINRLIGLADPSQQTSLIQQTIDYIRATEPDGLAREEKIRDLSDKLKALTNSTDSLNATMQSALSPFYSQDPRTTKLGFRAGVTGNPDWMTGATNANPLVAVLGPGATAPGMAGGGSFVVGGGYSANDNRMAVFPVASGEEIVVNRNKEGTGGQVIHIDNRIIVTGSVDQDALSKMKVSRYQQAQRMRAGMAQA